MVMPLNSAAVNSSSGNPGKPCGASRVMVALPLTCDSRSPSMSNMASGSAIALIDSSARVSKADRSPLQIVSTSREMP